jgi:PAS domain S-box-containing protein
MTRILIVDDKEENLYYLRALLTGHGYVVESARHGAEALAKARQSPPGIVISDLLMPVMDGYTLLRHWKSDQTLKTIPFIVYTATYTAPEDEELAMSLGADIFLVKPSEPEDFLARVRRVEADMAKAPAKIPRPIAGEEDALVQQYSEALVRKLEAKTLQLETANRALQEINTRLETLVGQANIGILVHHNFKPIMANRELARMLGYDSDSEVLVLPDCRVLFADEERERISTFNKDRLSGRDFPAVYPVKGRKKDGTAIDLENRAFSIQWGEQLSTCSMLTDVTEQKKMEEQLRQSQRLEAVGQMTGGIAHDFNNLLTVILGTSEFLAEGVSGNPELRSLAEMTRKAAERGAEMTSRLLAFSRRQTLDPKAADINSLVSGIDGLLRRAVGGRVELEIRLGKNTGAVLIDAAQLENALLNLSVNARDAMPAGGKLTVETKSVQIGPTHVAGQPEIAPGTYALISVSDNGTGMDEETRHHAFEPFFTTKDFGKGSGLGLSMVYGFVTQSKGHVRIRSEPGNGTCIEIYLPGFVADAETADVERRLNSTPAGSERILVVEDDDLVRQHVMILLKNLGYQATSARNAAEALAALKTSDGFDLLFTDVVMPGGINGLQLADEAHKLHPGLPVLLSSGYTDATLPQAGSPNGNFHLLRKPYRRQDLATKIRAALGREPVEARPSPD